MHEIEPAGHSIDFLSSYLDIDHSDFAAHDVWVVPLGLDAFSVTSQHNTTGLFYPHYLRASKWCWSALVVAMLPDFETLRLTCDFKTLFYKIVYLCSHARPTKT